MTSRHWLDFIWTPASSLPAATRLTLFRDGRLAAAAIALALFPLLAVASPTPVPVIVALLLAGLLPAVIALETRRAAALDRAVTLNVVALSAVLAAGVLKGLPAAAALMLLMLAAVEAGLAAHRNGRNAAILAAAAGVMGVSLAAGRQEAAIDPAAGAAASLAVAMLALTGAVVLVRGLVTALRSQAAAALQDRVLNGDIESVVSETVLAMDRTGGVFRVSGNAPRVLGLPSAALLGRGLVELTLVADRPALLAACRNSADVATRQKLRLRLRESAGDAMPRYRWAEICIEPASVDGLTVASLRDVSAGVMEEERLIQAASAAEAANATRDAFLTTVNHELRTPLNAIIGFSEFLANPATTPDERERIRDYARMVNDAGQDLMRKVSAMIDITRIDAGIYGFEAEDADLATLVESAVEAFRQEPEGQREVIALTPTPGPMMAHVDARAVRSMLHELLSNAVKFGKGRGVDVALAQDSAGVSITVRDRGDGIAPEKLQQIGRHFERLDESLGRAQGGIGLGLALARGLMALHGGRIGVDSAPGKGTAVTLRFGGDSRPLAADNILKLDAVRNAAAAASAHRKERKRA